MIEFKLMKNVFVLGSTGSVGKQTMDVLRRYNEDFQVFGIAARSNVEEISNQIKEFKPKVVCMESGTEELSSSFPEVQFYSGEEGLLNLVKREEVDIVVISSSGTSAFAPLIESIKAKKKILIANKESIIIAGDTINKYLKEYGGELIPLDSEHSAIFECLKGENKNEVENLILTCSGGPFRERTKEELISVTKEEAINHPVWKMGSKITIDSATLMNKGLEVIEAHHLFQFPIEKIKVVVHPECIIHSMIEFKDGSIKALLSAPDMKAPIQSALFHPQRAPQSFKKTELNNLSFFSPDMEKFPSLKIAYDAGKRGGSAPAALVFADEVVVEKFLNDEISFFEIADAVNNIVHSHDFIKEPTIEDILRLRKKIYEGI